jgi:hypothetical protein
MSQQKRLPYVGVLVGGGLLKEILTRGIRNVTLSIRSVGSGRVCPSGTMVVPF